MGTKLKKGTPVIYKGTGESGKINYYDPQSGDLDIKIGKNIISTHISQCKCKSL